jgi:tRNA pseudouridine32 synthase / 23S rRNA pseudouridine746 synthase
MQATTQTLKPKDYGLQHIGHVMLGDPIYAQDVLGGQAFDLSPRLCLHAHKLRLKHPNTGVWMEWESPVPF